MPVAALFNVKAKKWVRGRQDIFKKLEAQLPGNGKKIWVHCASLGEFEQGRPVIENIRANYPGYKILLTFFSPSGYEAQQNYKGVDWIFYLPVDGPRHAKRFLEIVQPSLVIFVKYEFWYYYLKKIKYREIPLLLISALFRKDMPFFKWHGALQRKMLARFDHLFVQNKSSKELIDGIGLADICSISGDTRFDRVTTIAKNATPIPAIEKFIGHHKTIIAGSTWKEDELVLQKAFSAIGDENIKLIIAPHEISGRRLKEIQEIFPGAILFSRQPATGNNARILIVDNIGMLARLYQYAWLTYVGGALKPIGVHNVLEAAVYNKIVFFGPFYRKYSEAVELVQSGGGLSFMDEKKDGIMLTELIRALAANQEEYNYRSQAAGNYVREHTGATEKIMQFIQAKRLLTN